MVILAQTMQDIATLVKLLQDMLFWLVELSFHGVCEVRNQSQYWIQNFNNQQSWRYVA